MSNPLFSILIPTRDRPVTLRHTLESVMRQHGDYEIVVADNCSSPAVRLIVEEFAAIHPRLRYVRSDTILPMSVNWESGLAQCSGEYVTVLGDDDALLPSALRHAAGLVAESKPDILSWALHTYWWPDTIAWWNANRLSLTFSHGVQRVESADMLKQFYDFRISFGLLPMIYNAFVSRRLIVRVIADHGCYFHPPEIPPDVSSGILNLSYTERFVYCAKPLAVRGNSGKSNGTAHWARAFGAERRETYLREEGRTLEELSHPDMIASENLDILIATTMLKCRDIYFSGSKEYTVDPHRVLERMVANLNFEPEAYDANLADARRLAAKLNVDISGRIPERRASERRPQQGLMGSQNGITGIVVNCDQAGIFDVAAAARLAEAMLNTKL